MVSQASVLHNSDMITMKKYQKISKENKNKLKVKLL